MRILCVFSVFVVLLLVFVLYSLGHSGLTKDATPESSLQREYRNGTAKTSTYLSARLQSIGDSLRGRNTSFFTTTHEHNVRKNASSLSTSRTEADMDNPLNDQTVQWDTDMYRPWLDLSVPSPPAMLLLTTFGWNHANQTFGIDLYRGGRSRELLEGIINHPWFHATAWEDLNSGKMEVSNTTRYYVFLDSETCYERNYPRYGYGMMVNRDAKKQRGVNRVNVDFMYMMRSKVLQAPQAKYVLFECGGWGPAGFMKNIKNKFSPKEKLAFVSLSIRRKDADPWDQGLPPPAGRKFYLTDKEKNDITICNETSRPTLISFSGSLRSQTRKDLEKLSHNEVDMLVSGRGAIQLLKELLNTTDPGKHMERLAKRSMFGATSRGDNLFSYRFSEVMSCGAIPVVYADDWLLPFGEHLIKWTEAVVIIRENETMQTKTILSQISREQRCRMRQKVVEIYQTYMETGRCNINGIIENFERSAALSENP